MIRILFKKSVLYYHSVRMPSSVHMNSWLKNKGIKAFTMQNCYKSISLFTVKQFKLLPHWVYQDMLNSFVIFLEF